MTYTRTTTASRRAARKVRYIRLGGTRDIGRNKAKRIRRNLFRTVL